MALSVIKYGEFTFPYNPSSTSFTSEMKVAKHQYPNVNGADLEFLGAEPIEITCKGVFFVNSKDMAIKLYNVYKQGKIQSFSHPIFPDCTRCIMTKLQLSIEAENDVVHYDFTVLADRSSYPSTVKVSGSNANHTGTGAKATTKKKTKASYKLQKTHTGWTKIKKRINDIVKKKNKKASTITIKQLKAWNKKLAKKTTIPKGSKIIYYY